MPRANRYFLTGHIWHLTHRCHKQEFLLKFAKDRKRWLYWLFEARKRYRLCVLNYVVTRNHIHLLVKDTGDDVIPRSIQLIHGRTAWEYNRRKSRRGAFWEDRYHATAVESNEHLYRCIAYIDLNMVRAGAVDHPEQWLQGGYREVQTPPLRYRISDIPALMRLCSVNTIGELQHLRAQWVANKLESGDLERDPVWSECIAVGNDDYVEAVHAGLGIKGKYRTIMYEEDRAVIQEDNSPYSALFGGKKGGLRP